MTRPIKFRAWEKPAEKFAGKMWYDNDLGFIGYCLSFAHKDEYEVMQFTGLLDKNGKEIYEDDIVRIRHPRDVGGDFEDTVGRVFYDDELGGFYHGNSEGRPPKRFWEYCEVIGNIYENPELINI